MTYRPLPNNVTIKRSSIDGLGLFAVVDIPAGTVIGISHVKDDRFENGYIRTPLGGFYNHSDNPNCQAYQFGDLVKLHAIKNIQAGEEITSRYWLYNLSSKSS